MKGLDDKRLGEVQQLAKDLNAGSVVVMDAANEVEKMINALNEKILAYNNILHNANHIRNEIVGQMEDFKNEKSENWQESESGSLFQEWLDEWENANFDPLEVVGSIDLDEPDHGLMVSELPTEPETP